MNIKRKIVKDIALLYRKQSSILNHYLKELDISSGNYPIIVEIFNNEGISLNEISKRIYMDKSVVTRFVNILIKKDIVIKEKNQNDKRYYNLYLTEKGEKIYYKLVNAGKNYYNDLFNKDVDINIEKFYSDIETLLKETNKIYNNLKKD
ncbi:MarR family winged helix-turn-helix transcriptional regulator [Psychrilyobacter atlanticus]|uniref:MarR family winged helix-turn-helix transcriptional regulator n=1 Tax=Psychrilyobacter atlanticus TaxID=271091 RepID=UPI0003FB3FE3|nr:MarR family transcriptional regulator [Psychrilyobacter atlanticus]